MRDNYLSSSAPRALSNARTTGRSGTTGRREVIVVELIRRHPRELLPFCARRFTRPAVHTREERHEQLKVIIRMAGECEWCQRIRIDSYCLSKVSTAGMF